MRSSPGRRRLRFSFQINDVKDLSRLAGPTRLTPGVGGGGEIVASAFRVNRLFRGRPGDLAGHVRLDQKAKTLRQGAEGVPLRLAVRRLSLPYVVDRDTLCKRLSKLSCEV